MKKLLTGSVAAAALVSASMAYAADLPVYKAPPAPLCPTCNWSGFYIGANAGGSLGWDRSSDTATFSAPGVVAAISPGIVNPALSAGYLHAPAGAVAGGQIGFNWQFGNWVVGVEGDWDWTRQRDGFDAVSFIASTTSSNFAQINYHNDEHMKWLATARARLGWAHNCFFWYVTGGGAWAELESNYSFFAPGATPGGGVPLASVPGAASFSSTRSGWTVGAGVETSLNFLGGWGGNWSMKAEYLYVDLGSVTNTFSVSNTAATARYNITSTSDITDHIIRVGVNYRFGGGPIIARY
jgi:outer membrane immunogenic protein